jgi:hypothetical protein
MGDIARWLRAEWDRVAGFGLIGLGALLLVLGYSGVSRSPYVAEQLAYVVSGGLGGLFCLGVGGVLLISADLHDEWRKLDRIEVALRQAASAAQPAAAQPDEGRSPVVTVGEAPPTTVGIAPDLQQGQGASNGHGPVPAPDPVGDHGGNGSSKAPRPLLARARRASSEHTN